MGDSGALLKAAAVSVVAYVLCLGAALVALFVTAVVTTRWGASRTGNAMLLMLGIDAFLFLASTLLVFLVLGRWLPGRLWRALISAFYLALAVGTGFALAFMSAVVLNR